MENPYSKEIKRYLKLRMKAQESNNIKEESECCNVLGNEFLKQGDFSQALLMHKSELNICQSIGDTIGQAIANRNIGDVYVAMNKFDEAIKHHKKHLQLSKDNLVELQRAHTSLGRTFLEFGRSLDDTEEATDAFLKSSDMLLESLKIVATLKEEKKVSQNETNAMKIRSLINLGICHHRLAAVSTARRKNLENEKSKDFFQKAVYLAKRYNFTEDLYLANFVLTTVNTDEEQFVQAVRHIESAVRLAKSIGKKDLLSHALDLSSQVHLMMENLQASKSSLKQLYKLDPREREDTLPRLKAVLKMCRVASQITSAQDPSLLFHLHETLADAYCDVGFYRPALKHYKTQEELLDKLPEATSQQKRSVYFSIASTLADLDDYDAAIAYYKLETACTNDGREQSKTWSHIASCLDKKRAGYEEIERAFKKSLECCKEADDQVQKLRVLISLEEVQRAYNELSKASNTRQRINELELRLEMCADELNDESITEEPARNSFPLDDSEELFNEEMALSDEDTSQSEDVGRRRRRANFSKTNEKGETLLHRACIDGQLKSVQVLIKQGHPLNPRDFCGWTPLHEACNHGHEDIVTCLLENGAHINDTGGRMCDRITPINDAATNGHFGVVQLLLDHGADPNIASTQGKTTLDSLIHYYQQHNEDLDDQSRKDYKRLHARLKEMAGRTCTSLRGAQDSQPEDSENPSSETFALIPDDDESPVSSQASAEHQSASNPKPSNRKRPNDASRDYDDDLPKLRHQPSGPSRHHGRPPVAPQPASPFVSAFQHTPDRGREDRGGGKHTSSDVFPRKGSSSKPSTALCMEQDHIVDDDDWLVEDVDTFSQPIKRHKRSNELPRINAALSDWLNNPIPPEIPPSSSESGRAEIPQKTPPSEPPPSAAFRLKVKINDKSFLFAVPGRDKTVSWLVDKAACRFEEVMKLKPVLSLATVDGCLLSPDDALYHVLNNNDTLIGQVESWATTPFPQQYAESCLKERKPVLPQIKRACEICQTTKVFQLLNFGFSFKKHLKPVIQCLNQQDLHKILLPGNRLNEDGVACLCDVLNKPSPRETCRLTEADLTCTGLVGESLCRLSLCTPMQSLTRLNLSFNPLYDGRGLKSLLQAFTHLKFLNLKCCFLVETSFSNIDSSCTGLEHLDVSQNTLGSAGLKDCLRMLDRSKAKRLVLNGIADLSNNSSVATVVASFLGESPQELQRLELVGNCLSPQHQQVIRSMEHLVEEIAL